MKFILVNPGFLEGGMATVFRIPPLGLLYLAGAITKAGDHDVKIIDSVVDKKSFKQLKAEFNNTDVVGVSALTSSFSKAKKFCELAKETGATTIMGGFQPTLMPEVAEFPEIDAVIRGEGEATMYEVARKMGSKEDWRRTEGVSYYDRDVKKLVHMPDRPIIPNLDQLPMPRYDLVDHYKYTSLGYEASILETSRGCSFGCNFCCVSKVYGRSWRPKSIDRVVQEHRLIPDKIKWIFNVDDNYVLNPKRAIELSKRLVQEGLDKRSMIVQARADALARYPEMVKWLAATGVRVVFIGVESIHPRSLKYLNKGISTVKYISQALKNLHENGIASWASIIAGVESNYNDAKEALDITTNFLIGNHVNLMQCTPLTAYPGTDFYAEAVQKGWIKPVDLSRPTTGLYPTRNEFKGDQLLDLAKRSMRRFYTNPKFFLSISKWQDILVRSKWRWLPKVLVKFAQVGIKDFILGSILADKIWEEEDEATPQPIPAPVAAEAASGK